MEAREGSNLTGNRGVIEILNLVLILVWGVALVYMVLHSDHYFWDFRVYHAAARAFLKGGDPFDSPYHVYVGYGWAYLPFVYPPLTILAFAPFGLIGVQSACLVWLGLKLVALYYLIRVWRRRFAPKSLDFRLGLLLLFGFNAALYTDLASGNAAIFEAAALFGGIEALLNRGLLKFASLVVLVSLFKFLPIVFLGLLPLLEGKRGLRPAIYGLLSTFLYGAANIVYNVIQVHEFIALLGGRDEDRANNPTLYTFFRDLGERADQGHRGTILYAIGAVALIYFTWIVVKSRSRRAPVMTVLFLWTAFAVLSPRFMIYTFVELIPMAWIALSRTQRLERWILAILIGFVTPTSYLFIERPTDGQLLARLYDIGPACYGYFSLFAAIWVWFVLRRQLLEIEPHAESAAVSSQMGAA